VLIGRVVDHQLGDHLESAAVCFGEELPEVVERPVRRVNLRVEGYVVAIIFLGARIVRQQPDRADSQLLQVVELLGQPLEVADPVPVRVGEALHVQLVDDRVLVPERVDVRAGLGRGGLDDRFGGGLGLLRAPGTTWA
jgi:hypothetical protein